MQLHHRANECIIELFSQLKCKIPYDQLSMLQLLSATASQKLRYTCYSQTHRATDGFRLVGWNGDTWKLDSKNIKFESDGCQLASLDEVILTIISTSIIYTILQSAGWLTREYKSDIAISGHPESLPLATIVPDQRNLEFGVQTERACFCNEL